MIAWGTEGREPDMDPSENIHPLSVFTTEEGRGHLKAADVIIGHDEAHGGQPALFFGRETLDRIISTGQSDAVNIVLVAYDSRTDQLEWLISAVTGLKGSCCYEASKPEPKVSTLTLPDGTREVRTTDADPYFAEDRAASQVELQAALDGYRAGGCPRPVVFCCAGRDEKTSMAWRQLEPALKEAGKSISNAADQWLPRYVVATDVARRLLAPIVGKEASRLFRVPTWPVSYWSVGIGPEEPKVYESRTFKDAG
jgi:hypothetical protein